MRFVTLCLLPILACVAQTPLSLSARAWVQANARYDTARAESIETGACVASGAYRWGYRADGRLWVQIDSFAQVGPTAARLVNATAIRLNWAGSVCGDSLPAYHTHLWSRGPSKCDMHTLAERPRVPFHLVQFAKDSILVYWIAAAPLILQDTSYHC